VATGTDPARGGPGEAATTVADLPYGGPLQGSGAPDWRIWMGLGLTVGWLILGALYIDASIGWSGIAAQPAEVIGNFLEGAFAPLAFLWLVIGYFLQQKELAQNTDALRQQFREIQRSAEQAVIQSQTIARSEIHSRQETFLKISERVRGQLGAIIGLLYVSSQGGNGNGRVSTDEMASLWAELNKGDPDTFSRRMLELHASEEDPAERMALFYGTEIRARHTNNFIFTFERLRQRAREADTDGILEDAIVGSAHGFVHRLARAYQKVAPEHLADIRSTGRDVRLGGMIPDEPVPANDATGDIP
jgi:hypothetical protein